MHEQFIFNIHDKSIATRKYTIGYTYTLYSPNYCKLYNNIHIVNGTLTKLRCTYL